MIKITNVRELKQTLYIIEDLQKISKRLHTQDENACNYGLTPRQETRVKNLKQKAQELAQKLGLHAYHQGDPRGCSLYLVENTKDIEQYYPNGIAICR